MAFLKNAAIKKLSMGQFFAINQIIHRKIKTSCSCRSVINMAFASYESTHGSEKTNVTKPTLAPVIIMHGLFGSKNNWNTLAKVIHQRTNRKVIAVDARNHGESPHSSLMSYPDMAEDVIKLLESLELGKAILIGHSMGGGTMMYTALNYPERIEKLIVVDFSPLIRTRNTKGLSEMGQIFDAMLSAEIKNGLPLSESRKLVDRQLTKIIHSETLRQFLLMNLVEYEPGKLKWRVNLPVLAEKFSNHIAKFPLKGSEQYTGPTLFIGGGRSDYIKKEDHPSIKKLFPRAEIRYIDGAGHWVQSEKPAEFLDMTVHFINEK
ncbi:protein ABHD11-like isoform X2 [Venturia canescens]|uniref:protein ABHD11-like isoform X2 n=1 Tax=Venturia canescens TaxID=32260 RepID=UPI001C9D1AEA|nr:protein ABHD11-like isoform X2 [Venturia canescens]